MRRGLSGSGSCCGSVCGLRKIVGSHNFSMQFVGVISHFKGTGYLFVLLLYVPSQQLW